MKFDRDSLENELKHVSPQVRASLAYRCALRVFPLLAVNGGFDYWKEDKKKHLYALFNIFDTNAGLKSTFTLHGYVSLALEAAAAYDAADIVDNVADCPALKAAMYTAFTVADDATAFSVAYSTSVDVYDAAGTALRALSAASCFSVVYEEQFRKSLQFDLETIKNSGKHDELLSVPLWIEKTDLIRSAELSFKAALESPEMNFGYWWSIYEQHSERNIDPEALKQRLSLPEEIKEKGPEFITDYLVSLRKKSDNLGEI